MTGFILLLIMILLLVNLNSPVLWLHRAIKWCNLGFIGAISILETGLLHSFYGADKFANALSSGDGIACVADVIEQGKCPNIDPLLCIDYFPFANESLSDIRKPWWD